MKRTEKKLDTIFWGIMYGLPVWLYAFTYLPKQVADIASRWLDEFGDINISFAESLFDYLETIGLAIPNIMQVTFSWMILATFVHIITDTILILPRLCLKWGDRFGE